MNKQYLLIHRLIMITVILFVIIVSFVATNGNTSANTDTHQVKKITTEFDSGIRD